MPGLPANSMDLFTGGISFLLTLMVLSYLIGDNPAFRVAVYIFIGVSAGYAAGIAWHQVLYPQLIVHLGSGKILAIIPLVLGLMLMLKVSTRTTRLGTPSVAFMVGVGAAVAISGAVMGTIFPQAWASITKFNFSFTGQYWLERLGEGIFMLIGTLTTLAYFHFGAKATAHGPQRSRFVRGMSWIGQIFIAITFGVLFAGVFLATLVVFIDRIHFIIQFLSSL